MSCSITAIMLRQKELPWFSTAHGVSVCWDGQAPAPAPAPALAGPLCFLGGTWGTDQHKQPNIQHKVIQTLGHNFHLLDVELRDRQAKGHPEWVPLLKSLCCSWFPFLCSGFCNQKHHLESAATKEHLGSGKNPKQLNLSPENPKAG